MISKRLPSSLLARMSALTFGAIGVLAFSPFELPYLLLISLAGLYYLTVVKPIRHFSIGFWFGLGYFGCGTYWVFNSIYVFGDAHILLAGLMTLLLICYQALYTGVISHLTGSCIYQAFRPFVFASLIITTEWVRSHLMTGFPWLLFGYSQTTSLFSGLIPVIGVLGTSFVLGLFASSIVSVKTSPKRAYHGCVSIVLLIIAIASYQHPWTKQTEHSLHIGLVQASIPQELKWSHEHMLSSLELHQSLTQQIMSKSDVVVWPETAVPLWYHQASDFLHQLNHELLRQPHRPILLTGVPYFDTSTDKMYNSLLSLGENQHLYHKRVIVPFGEFVPFKSILSYLSGFFNLPLSGLSKGPLSNHLLDTEKAVFAPFICYEIAYDHVVRTSAKQAQYLVTISNDAWFGDSVAPDQHFQIAQSRSLQTGRAQVVCANDGISGFIDANGRVLCKLKRYATETLSCRLHAYTGMTPWLWLGNAPMLLLACLCLLLGVVAPKLRRLFKQ